jgi:3-mercaptopyruvate sulfurtransferase SseA
MQNDEATKEATFIPGEAAKANALSNYRPALLGLENIKNYDESWTEYG